MLANIEKLDVSMSVARTHNKGFKKLAGDALP